MNWHCRKAILILFILLSAEIEKCRSLTQPDEDALNNINSVMSTKSTGTQVARSVNTIRAYIKSNDGNTAIQTVSSSARLLSISIDMLSSDDPVDIVTASLNIASIASLAIPVYGPAVSAVMVIASSTVSLFKDEGTKVNVLLKRQIDNFAIDEMKHRAMSAQRSFMMSAAYIEGFVENHPFERSELDRLHYHVMEHDGITLLGDLASRVMTLATGGRHNSVVVKYIEFYVTLASLRNAVMSQYLALVKSMPMLNSTAGGISNVIEMERQHDTTFLDFLVNPADNGMAKFLAYFVPSEWPITRKFMAHNDFVFPYHPEHLRCNHQCQIRGKIRLHDRYD